MQTVVKVTYTRKSLFCWGYGPNLSEAIASAKRHFASQCGKLKNFGSDIPDSAYLFIGDMEYSPLLLAVQTDKLTDNGIKQYFLN